MFFIIFKIFDWNMLLTIKVNDNFRQQRRKHSSKTLEGKFKTERLEQATLLLLEWP